MLGNEVQLFFQLLDSLSNSLRELAVKYELLVVTTSRQSNSIEKTDETIVDIAEEVTSSFNQLSKNFESLRTFASDSKYKDAAIDASINTLSKLIESININMAELSKIFLETKNFSSESKSVVLHIDSHMDSFGNQLTYIQSAFVSMSKELTEMRETLYEIKNQLEPLKKLAILFSKPIPILLAIYFIITSVLAFMKIKAEFDNVADKKVSSITQSAHGNVNADLK